MSERALIAREIRQACQAMALPAHISRALVSRVLAASPTRERHGAILRAADLLDPHGEDSRWALAGRLEAAIKRFDRETLPAIRRGLNRDLTPLEIELQTAFGAGAVMIKTRRRLHDLLKS